MNFFYKYDAPEYTTHMNKEGEYIAENIKWHTENNTYLFSYGLGAVICIIGLMIAVYPVWPGVSALGSLLACIMSLVTLSFLITTFIISIEFYSFHIPEKYLSKRIFISPRGSFCHLSVKTQTGTQPIHQYHSRVPVVKRRQNDSSCK